MLVAGRRSLVRCGCVLLAALGAGCGGSHVANAPRAGGAFTGSSSHASGDGGPSAVARIAGGGFAGYAVLADGRVWAWGDDLEGQIGSAARVASSVPVPVPGLANIVAVAAGTNTAYALQRGGAVWAWGDDSQGELGDSGSAPRSRPAQVRVPGPTVAIAAGGFSAFALRGDGTVWAWGNDSLGQLGTGDCTDATCPPPGVAVKVPRIAQVRAIAASINTAYALRRDGTVWAWGDNSVGELGAGDCAAASCPAVGVPVRVSGLTDVRSIAAGANTAYALRRDGTVWAWGGSSFGALGSRVVRPFVDRPVHVNGVRRAVAMAAGAYAAYVLLPDGTVQAWGRDREGELGDGSIVDRAAPRPVSGLGGVVQVAGGGDSAYAIDRQGKLWAWGDGVYGQLGDGYWVSLDTPIGVLGLQAHPWSSNAKDVERAGS